MEDFKAKISTAGKVVFVDYFADWCGPCKVIGPLFEALSEQFPDAIFIKVNVDEVEAAAEDYKVESLPTFMVFKEGKNVAQMVGANKEQLEKFIKEHAKA